MSEEVTLDDVESMIRILERFLKISRKAQRIMRELAPRGGVSQTDFMKYYLDMVMQKTAEKHGILAEEYEEEELSPEDLEVIKKIRARREAESQKQPQK